MAGTESSETPILKLNLLVDKEKNEVVFAQAGKDFVDVLFGFMALPMGTIVRLLEKNKQNSAPIGCFNNLYKSVVDMDKVDFTTEDCKDMLLYPRYVKEKQCRRLKLNIDDDDRSNLMRDEFKVPEGGSDELFVTPRTSFIISGNMKVEFASLSRAIKILVGLGHNNFDRLEEMFVDVNHEEVLSLLHCLFFSETPFTDVFLKKHSSCGLTTLPLQDRREARVLTYTFVPDDEEVSLTVFVRKQDMKVLYAESGEDFVDLLFTFLAIPLESVWEITGSNIELGCINNFCRSMSSSEGNACMLPWHYSLEKCSLLGVSYLDKDGSSQLTPHSNTGFVKRGARYMISDDLTITAANSCSIISLLEKLDTNLGDIEKKVIDISKADAISLLKASLVTSTPLTTALWRLLQVRDR